MQEENPMTDSDDDDSPTQTPFTLVPHTADLAIQVWGHDIAALFANAAIALFSVMAPIRQANNVRYLEVEAIDYEDLLVNWLNELIWRHETEGMSYTNFKVTEITPTHLAVVCSSGIAEEIRMVVKAATFHDLHIIQTPHGYEATVVFDV